MHLFATSQQLLPNPVFLITSQTLSLSIPQPLLLSANIDKQTFLRILFLHGHLRPMQDEDTQVFEDAAKNTATALAESWMSWSSGQQALPPPSILQHSSSISSTQTWKVSEQQKELATTSLDSFVLSPFTESISEFNEHDSASVLDSIYLGKVFGHCDLASGYWQIPLNSQDHHKSAFCTDVGLYESLRIKNST